MQIIMIKSDSFMNKENWVIFHIEILENNQNFSPNVKVLEKY